MAEAVCRNSPTSQATDTEVKNEVKDWLKFSKDRDGGRCLRYILRNITLMCRILCSDVYISYLVSYLVWPHGGPISMRPRALRTMQDP